MNSSTPKMFPLPRCSLAPSFHHHQCSLGGGARVVTMPTLVSMETSYTCTACLKSGLKIDMHVILRGGVSVCAVTPRMSPPVFHTVGDLPPPPQLRANL